MKEGEAEAILKELICKQISRRGRKTLVVQFYIRLLTLILSESGNEYGSISSNFILESPTLLFTWMNLTIWITLL